MKTCSSVLVLLLETLLGPATGLFIRKHIYIEQYLTWTEAQTYCRAHHADLSTINSPEEYLKFRIDTSVYQSNTCWIGLAKRTTENIFTQWSDGTLLGFEKWCQGQPNDPSTDHCVKTENNEWYDYGCSTAFPFFCYVWEPRMIVVQEMKTWMEALEHCRKFYTDLISLNTKNYFFLTESKSSEIQTPSAWIGLRFLYGSWFWVNKEPLGNLTQLLSCPARPWVCGAKRAGEDVMEKRDCEEKMNFICYHHSG